jgi:glycerophosphoryl diester phosphodiesterase
MDDDDPMINWNDKGNITDWFTFDFDLAELQELRTRQVNELRDPSYDWTEPLVTLEQLVTIVREEGAAQGRTIGIYPEIKNAFATNRVLAARGDPRRLEDYVLEELERLGLHSAASPVLLQNFELSSIEYVDGRSEVRQVFVTKRNLTAANWARVEAIESLAGLGASKDGLVTPGRPDQLGRGRNRWQKGGTSFLGEAHRRGLAVHCYTFKNEWTGLYWQSGQDPYAELDEFIELGTDGFFADFPLTVRRFLHWRGLLCSPGPTAACASCYGKLYMACQGKTTHEERCNV